MHTIQRYIQSLGITTANNCQTNADPAVNDLGYSAYYSPIDKSLHMGTSRPCHPDKSQEGDAIIHEYGHAIQDNQVPGWGVTNPVTGRDETGAMGEGFGDTLACVFFATFGNGFQRETFEDWAFVENGASGLRRVDGTKVYPTDWASEVHADRSPVVRLAASHLRGDLVHHAIDVGGHVRVADDAEHPRRLVEVRRELVGPVGDAGPLARLEELPRRDVQRVGVHV